MILMMTAAELEASFITSSFLQLSLQRKKKSSPAALRSWRGEHRRPPCCAKKRGRRGRGKRGVAKRVKRMNGASQIDVSLVRLLFCVSRGKEGASKKKKRRFTPPFFQFQRFSTPLDSLLSPLHQKPCYDLSPLVRGSARPPRGRGLVVAPGGSPPRRCPAGCSLAVVGDDAGARLDKGAPLVQVPGPSRRGREPSRVWRLR